jgi:hypothetical protein
VSGAGRRVPNFSPSQVNSAQARTTGSSSTNAVNFPPRAQRIAFRRGVRLQSRSSASWNQSHWFRRSSMWASSWRRSRNSHQVRGRPLLTWTASWRNCRKGGQQVAASTNLRTCFMARETFCRCTDKSQRRYAQNLRSRFFSMGNFSHPFLKRARLCLRSLHTGRGEGQSKKRIRAFCLDRL